MKTPVRKLSTVRTRLREQRAVRQRQAQLEHELAMYATPSDRADLDALLSRHTPEQTREIEAILVKQAIKRQRDFTRPAR